MYKRQGYSLRFYMLMSGQVYPLDISLENLKDRLGIPADKYKDKNCLLHTSRSLSLGGRPRERYTEEERQLLRDIAQLKGTLQRLNN